jgi:hypothetical protein
MTLNRLTTTILTTIAVVFSSSVSAQGSSAKPDLIRAELEKIIAPLDGQRSARPSPWSNVVLSREAVILDLVVLPPLAWDQSVAPFSHHVFRA